jgi:uncharacterized protein (DUF302 family)
MPNDAQGITTLASAYSFDDTVGRLLDAFRERGIKVFATIDQQAEARAVGLTMPPTTLILFGNPKAGTPLMLARPESGIDLPLKVLVTQAAPGRVLVTLNTAAYVVRRHALPPELAANIAPAEKLVAGAIA